MKETCPSCGSPLAGLARFCAECGAEVAAKRGVEAEAPTRAEHPRLAQPTPRRATRQEVLIPPVEAPSGETLPARPKQRLPTWAIGVAALPLAVFVLLAMFAPTRWSHTDGARQNDSASNGHSATAPPPIAVHDSGLTQGVESLLEKGPVAIDGAEIIGRAVAPERTPTPRARHATRARVVAPEPRSPSTPVALTCERAYAEQSWAHAVALCSTEAELGNVAAARNLGVMYEQGLGVVADAASAARLLQKAGEAGNADAARRVGLLYERGRGVSLDMAQAAAWYRRSALLGDRDAQAKLGQAYESGSGVSRDFGEALTWFQKAAAQGNVSAQVHLGTLYGNGTGVQRDDAQAAKWFRMAADRGDPLAQYNLGLLYADGRGVPRSDGDAVSWFRKAASQGHEAAEGELRRRGITP